MLTERNSRSHDVVMSSVHEVIKATRCFRSRFNNYFIIVNSVHYVDGIVCRCSTHGNGIHDEVMKATAASVDYVNGIDHVVIKATQSDTRNS